MKMSFLITLSLAICLQVSAQAGTKKVLSCNADKLQAYFEDGQYSSMISTIIVTDQGIAKYITKDFPITKCGSNTFEKVCWDNHGFLIISSYGPGPNERAFTWLNSRASLPTDKGTRRARLTIWRDLQSRPNGSGVRFQLMSNEGVNGANCGPTGEGPCLPVWGNKEKVTYRDWFFDNCSSR